MSDIADRVKKIVVEHLGVEAEKVTENASFIDDLGADSHKCCYWRWCTLVNIWGPRMEWDCTDFKEQTNR